MPSSETNPKPVSKPMVDKPTEKDVKQTREEDKNVDRDGRERQPSEHTDQKT